MRIEELRSNGKSKKLISSNINIRTGRTSVVSLDFFTKSSPERDYFIGLLCTDGSIGSTDYGIQIQLNDKEILEEVGRIINVPVYEKIDKRYNSKMYMLRFRNKNIHKYLVSIGLTPKKTSTLKLSIPLNNHILRGIFDGDGSIFRNKQGRNIINIVSASKEFTEQIADFLKKSDISVSSVKFRNNVYNINIYRKQEVEKFGWLIYLNATLYINRKYMKFNAV